MAVISAGERNDSPNIGLKHFTLCRTVFRCNVEVPSPSLRHRDRGRRTRRMNSGYSRHYWLSTASCSAARGHDGLRCWPVKSQSAIPTSSNAVW